MSVDLTPEQHKARNDAVKDEIRQRVAERDADFYAPGRDDWATIFNLLTDTRVWIDPTCGVSFVFGYVTNRDGARIMIQAELVR